MLREVILDTLLDSARLLPFLFVAYLAIELLEHYAGDRTDRLMQRAGGTARSLGALVGVVPQCGFGRWRRIYTLVVLSPWGRSSPSSSPRRTRCCRL